MSRGGMWLVSRILLEPGWGMDWMQEPGRRLDHGPGGEDEARAGVGGEREGGLAPGESFLKTHKIFFELLSGNVSPASSFWDTHSK